MDLRTLYASQLREGFDFHATSDGYCFRYGGHVVERWPTASGAIRGMTLAAEVLAMLEETLARFPANVAEDKIGRA